MFQLITSAKWFDEIETVSVHVTRERSTSLRGRATSRIREICV